MMKELKIGGQAVVEGVMMRSAHYVSTSVRTKNGKIKTKTRKFNSLTENNKILGLPIIRGAVSLFEVIQLGYQEITWSSNQSLGKKEKINNKEKIFMILFSLIFGLALFKLLPLFLATRIIPLEEGSWAVNLLDALIKTLILVGYMVVIGLISDIKNLYQYHGAEHKAVSCYESKKKLTPENAQKFSTIHPRCGTTFIIIVFLISMLLYIFIPLNLGFWLNFLIRILLLPIIAGISFEIIRISGKYYYKNLFVRIIMWPGLQFQRLTTRQPSLKQIEVAIASLNACMSKEK